jgi:alpha-1,2-mannosyltransferase
MSPLITRLRLAVRDAAWLDADRVTAYGRVLLVMFCGLSVAWVALSSGGLGVKGKALGTDFTSFWTASQLALSGAPTAAYDPALHQAAQARIFDRDIGYAAFFYPPPFLLICLPLALLPYGCSLLAWLAVTGAAYVVVVRRIVGDQLGWLPVLAFPALWSNLGHGQNGFLSAALLGGGAWLLRSHPVLGGLCLGSLIYKPHLGLVIPVALIAARRWDAIAAAAFAAVASGVASYLVFGSDTWQAFFALTALARATLEHGIVGDAKMQSLFAAIRLNGGSLTLAYTAQALLGLGVCGLLIQLHRRDFRSEAEAPALVAGALLASPFLLDYDLTLLAIPLAWLARQGLEQGFRPYEKVVLALAFFQPLIARPLAMQFGLALTPFIVYAVLILIYQRRIDAQTAGVTPARRPTPPLLLGATRAI